MPRLPPDRSTPCVAVKLAPSLRPPERVGTSSPVVSVVKSMWSPVAQSTWCSPACCRVVSETVPTLSSTTFRKVEPPRLSSHSVLPEPSSTGWLDVPIDVALIETDCERMSATPSTCAPVSEFAVAVNDAEYGDMP